MYGPNNATTYSNTTNAITGATLLYQVSFGTTTKVYTLITDQTAYRYVHCLISGYQSNSGLTQFQIIRLAGTNSGLIKNTNFLLTSNASTGYPVITYTSATTLNLLYTYAILIIQECYRHLFPSLEMQIS